MATLNTYKILWESGPTIENFNFCGMFFLFFVCVKGNTILFLAIFLYSFNHMAFRRLTTPDGNGPPGRLPAEQCASCAAFTNERRKLNNTILCIRNKLNDKREELKRVKKKLKGRSYSMAAFVDITICESIQ